MRGGDHLRADAVSARAQPGKPPSLTPMRELLHKTLMVVLIISL